ncbi:hypothetical protein UPYG_G00301130 [Umbra pygmaea]|uniref:DUF6729 domain-containing protein n=1 Tax=Umbra pygmaea TaxID=75934 RepID=A0ABD0W6G9_UMBPY
MHATPEAMAIRGKPPLKAATYKMPEEVQAEARAHVVSEGVDPASEMLVLSSPRPPNRLPTSPRPPNRMPTSPRPPSRLPTSPRPPSRLPTSPRPHSRLPTCPRPPSWLPTCPRPPRICLKMYHGSCFQRAGLDPAHRCQFPAILTYNCFLGLNSGPATWPGTSRLVEAICSQLCRLNPCGTQSGGIKRSRSRQHKMENPKLPVTELEMHAAPEALDITGKQPTAVADNPESSFEVAQAADERHPTYPNPPQEEEVSSQSSLPPKPALGSAELLPESWRSTLNKDQQQWIGRVLFTRGSTGRSQLTTDLNLWWYPPQPRPVYDQPPTSPDPFFACPLFLWMPLRMWAFKLTCIQPGCKTPLTKAGLYKTIRRVLDIKGWYLMATEYLECPRCKKKVAGWSQGVLGQLDPAHHCQFPAILTYKLSCDLAVVGMLRERTLGNSATQLYTKLCEAHSDAWMRQSLQYLGECERFLTSGNIRPQFPPLPEMPKVPSPVWLLTVYSVDVLSRVDELKARVTSTFGSILKMDSTKKVTKKLAGAASDTAAWATNVANEHGQVLICVLTAGEGEGLLPMAAGLMERYRLAGVPPPQLMYVDRDCCSSLGGSKTAAMFAEWAELVVRLDIWHLIRRFAAAVITESHQLYGAYMRQLSSCIFEWDAGDVRRLLEAKRSELEGKHGMGGLTDKEVYSHLRRKELGLHCRRRTRGAVETELLLLDMLETFNGEKGHDTLGIPLLDHGRIQAIWQEQRRHLKCIQDPPGVELYTQTGSITKGGVMLPVYRCARGSTSLKSFNLNRFIPGTSASGMHFQAFLLDGLVRWNENRAAAAVGGAKQPLLCYSGHLQHSLNQLSQQVLGSKLVEDFTKPGVYTGELIGVEYLYSQTNKVLQAVSLDPDTPDEANGVEGPFEDEGIEDEEDEDPTVHLPDLSLPVASTSSTAPSGPPAEAPRSGPSRPAVPTDYPEAPEHPDSPPSESSEEGKGPESQPGYHHVRRLARALVEVKNLPEISDRRLDQLIRLWEALPQPDKERLVYPSRQQERLEWGRVKASKGNSSISSGEDSLQRSIPGNNLGGATWPETSRLVEAICTQLCRLHPCGTQSGGIKRSRWALILADYVSIREAVLDSPRLMAQTSLQLFELSQRTISQWYSRHQKERSVSEQGSGLTLGRSVSLQPLADVTQPQYQPPGLEPFVFVEPKDSSRQATQQGPAQVPTLPVLPVLTGPHQPQPCSLPGSSQVAPPLAVPRSTAYRKRKKAEAEATALAAGGAVKQRKQGDYKCGKCGQPKRRETGHSQFGSVSFCSATGGKTVEDWLAEMRDAKGHGAQGH